MEDFHYSWNPFTFYKYAGIETKTQYILSIRPIRIMKNIYIHFCVLIQNLLWIFVMMCGCTISYRSLLLHYIQNTYIYIHIPKNITHSAHLPICLQNSQNNEYHILWGVFNHRKLQETMNFADNDIFTNIHNTQTRTKRSPHSPLSTYAFLFIWFLSHNTRLLIWRTWFQSNNLAFIDSR